MDNFEIERKFIIRKPLSLNDLKRADMEQTYLVSEMDTCRVRMVKIDNVKKYYFTQKVRQNNLTCIENERQIDENEYKSLLLQADPARNTIYKSRYYYPYGGLIFEIDVYPFWERQCVMEVELTSEDQAILFPPNIQIIKEVTDDKDYKNVALAMAVPEEIAE